jgi:N-acetylglucosamine-6-phosphate deacetylase
MAPRILHGRNYRTGEPVLLHHEAGLITRIEPGPAGPRPLPWLAPSLFDLQVNGFAGVDFQRDDVADTDLESAALALAGAGCGRFLLTLITDTWPILLRRLARLREARLRSALLRQCIAGWHIEGPFLSDQPGYHGAHSPGCMLNPTPGHLAELRETAGTERLLLTLAPERSGAIDAIRSAVSLGIRVSLGHTNAPTEVLEKAFAAGAAGFTHLGNACPQALDRHDNILFRVIDALACSQDQIPAGIDPSRCLVTIIPDGIHVSPPLFRLLHHLPWRCHLGYVSDAMAAASAPRGITTLGSIRLEVGSDGIVRQPGHSNFAGSALRPIDGVLRAAAMLDAPWSQTWDRFSVIPASWMGIAHGLQPGCPADLCILDDTAVAADADDRRRPSLTLRTLLARGQELEQAAGHR